MQETWVQSLGQEDLLEKGMATHSSILTWRIAGTEEPGSPQFMGSLRVRHYWMTKHSAAQHTVEIKEKGLIRASRLIQITLRWSVLKKKRQRKSYILKSDWFLICLKMNLHFINAYMKIKLINLATWCEELTHWKRPWCWERVKAGGEGDDRGWVGWMASLTQWTWIWANSRR